MPLVPQASSPRRGLFSQRSTPCTSSRADLHVVVFDEDDVLPELGIARELHDFADVASCRADPWDAPCRRSRSAPACSYSEDLLQPLHVAEQQRGALVSGEAAGEADGERVRIEHFAGAPDLDRGRLPAQCRRMLARTHEGDQAPLAPAVRFQQFFVRECRRSAPRCRDR